MRHRLDRLGHRPHRAVGAEIEPFLGFDVGALPVAAHVFPIEGVLQRALDLEYRLVEQFVLAVAEALRGDAVGHDDAQALRFDEQDHLFRMVEQEAFETAHLPAASLFGVAASK